MNTEKDARMAGADERTPSRPEYFSWINNTNEGSTEEQTLINLDYFRYMHDTYGMQIEIYAWDAGNLDGSAQTYEIFDESEKLKKQYPNGYAPVVEKAKELGIRMGVWGGPDGFGNDPETAEKRKKQMVSLCKDYHFALFKFDQVCGRLKEENRPHFIEMMKACRKYSPDLILLNHRLDLGEEGIKYATTFLWGGKETYVDVHIGNEGTAPHHRGYFASRGNVPGLRRLTEDHGVCLSSCLDFFEDELIIQAFGRGLILAPEIYGNPWLLRDDEQAKLARIYNLHRKYRDILVTGMLLPGYNYPENAVSRGDEKRRFITCGNSTWETVNIHARLDRGIGLAPCEKVALRVHFPYEQDLGLFDYGAVADIPVLPFRACLIEACDASIAEPMLQNCKYEVLREDENGRVTKAKIVADATFDNTLRSPIKLGSFEEALPCDENAARDLELARFTQDHDSLEARSLRRSGATNIPEVQAARDAFFKQDTYVLRGLESRFAFDDNPDTFFDGVSKTLRFSGIRKDGGCLRVDFGGEYEADAIEIEYFDCDTPIYPELPKQHIPPYGAISADLKNWTETTLETVSTVGAAQMGVVTQTVNNILTSTGRRRVVTYPVNATFRYFKLPEPPDRIYRISLVKEGKRVILQNPKVNNLLPFASVPAYEKQGTVTVSAEDYRSGCYLSVALEGVHGNEGAYAVISCEGKTYACPDRAPSYLSNVWEAPVNVSMKCESGYTYYFPVQENLIGKELSVRVIGLDESRKDYRVDVWLCDGNNEIKGKIVEL